MCVLATMLLATLCGGPRAAAIALRLAASSLDNGGAYGQFLGGTITMACFQSRLYPTFVVKIQKHGLERSMGDFFALGAFVWPGLPWPSFKCNYCF